MYLYIFGALGYFSRLAGLAGLLGLLGRRKEQHRTTNRQDNTPIYHDPNVR